MVKILKRVCWFGFLLVWQSPAALGELGVTWTEATSEATSMDRYYHAAVAYDEKLWILGGGWLWTSDVWNSTDGTSWTCLIARAPWFPRQGHSCIVYDGKIWVIGGKIHNDVWSTTDGVNWTSVTLAAPWTPRYLHTSVVYDDKMWVIGGVTKVGYPEVPLYDVWYSTDGSSWTRATESGPPGIAYDHSTVVFHNRMWVISGAGVWSTQDGDQWTTAVLPPPGPLPYYWFKYGPQAVVCDGKIWAMGGWDLILGGVNQVWCSTDGATWRLMPYSPPWGGRYGHRLVVHDNKIWLLAGFDPGYKSMLPVLYNDVWYSEAPPPPARAAPSWRLYR